MKFKSLLILITILITSFLGCKNKECCNEDNLNLTGKWELTLFKHYGDHYDRNTGYGLYIITDTLSNTQGQIEFKTDNSFTENLYIILRTDSLQIDTITSNLTGNYTLETFIGDCDFQYNTADLVVTLDSTYIYNQFERACEEDQIESLSLMRQIGMDSIKFSFRRI